MAANAKRIDRPKPTPTDAGDRYGRLTTPCGTRQLDEPCPGVDLAFRMLPAKAVPVLEPSDQDLALAVDRGDVIIGQAVPMAAQPRLEHAPVPLELIPCHPPSLLSSPARCANLPDGSPANIAMTIGGWGVSS